MLPRRDRRSAHEGNTNDRDKEEREASVALRWEKMVRWVENLSSRGLQITLCPFERVRSLSVLDLELRLSSNTITATKHPYSKDLGDNPFLVYYI